MAYDIMTSGTHLVVATVDADWTDLSQWLAARRGYYAKKSKGQITCHLEEVLAMGVAKTVQFYSVSGRVGKGINTILISDNQVEKYRSIPNAIVRLEKVEIPELLV